MEVIVAVQHTNPLDTELSIISRQVFIEFAKNPHVNIFFKNKKGLIFNSETMRFDEATWNYNPLQFCEDHYGNQYIYPILLMVNNLSSLYQFNMTVLNNTFIAPYENYIMKLLTYELEDDSSSYNKVTTESLNIFNPNKYRDI